MTTDSAREHPIPWLELRTDANLGAIRVLNELLDVALRALGEDDSCRHDLALGVAELVANVCQHEYTGAAGGEVVVRLTTRPSELELTVTSQGPAFDLQAALGEAEEDEGEDDPLELLSGSGLGLPLVVGLFDTIEHAHSETEGNRITLVRRRSAQASSRK